MEHVPGVTSSGLVIEEARFYHEVCFRCHADNPVPLARGITRQREDDGNIRRLFLPTAASAHPVAFARPSDGETPSLLPAYRSRRLISCQDCHNNPDARQLGGASANGPHGSRFDNLLAARYDTADFTAESPQAYALCYRCHDRNSILNDESFSFHRVHLQRGRAPCSACHAPHGVSGSRANHDHLINFDVSIVSGERFYLDTGRFSGRCSLTCHGVRHVNFVYPPP
jgi:ribosomal protein L40E